MLHPPARTPMRHPVNIALDKDLPFGARIADRVTTFMGSWGFLVLQTILVAIWIGGNVVLLFHFDPYPFILLNLAFSTQAAYAAPLILLAGNRASQRDRMTLEHAAAQSDIEEAQNEKLLTGNREILQRVETLEKAILALEGQIKTAVERLDAGGPAHSR
ncbi:MAG TPA: DUF1003 domain-containing protein [Candidatus Limnocylindrales bacterium]|nr:DUF1003 domain-containing protein [Candidatus Limnocylindrales bacterium]